MNKLSDLKILDKQIAQLKEKRDTVERALRAVSRKELDAIPPVYSYNVVECSDPWETEGTIRLQRVLENGHEYDAVIEEFGYPMFSGFEAQDKRKVLSVAYKRNDHGVLTHSGGGWMLLEDGIPLSNSEWELLKQGNQGMIDRLLK